jgi:hypothetical protein
MAQGVLAAKHRASGARFKPWPTSLRVVLGKGVSHVIAPRQRCCRLVAGWLPFVYPKIARREMGSILLSGTLR